ncbi:aKG-HExxH-type peptide beta-hydroxylase, partial [Actinoallomurus acaciae]
RAGLEALAESRLSVNRALVARVAVGRPGEDRELARVAAEGWDLLCELDRTHGRAVREVLAHPYVQAWATRCLRPAPSSRADLDRAHLAGLAAAVALRAETAVELALPVRDGLLHLPTLGALRTGDAGTAVRVRITPDGIAAEHGGVWQPTRRIVAGGLALVLEDLDPFRGGGHRPVTGRLSSAGWRSWRSVLDAGARDLKTRLPSYADVLGRAAGSIVPLAGEPGGMSLPDAYGAVAAGLPPGPDELAEVLLGEFQSTKLNGITDLHDLYDPGRPLRPAGGDGPRPVADVLRGAYRSLALGELWRSRRDLERFRHHRTVVERGLDALLEPGVLTGDGRIFAEGMVTTRDRWARTD